MVELKTHAAQLSWNTCNPSLLSGFAFCWHIYFNHPPFFISPAWLAHTHTHTHTLMNQHIHTSHVRPIHTLSTIRHYSFPLAVNCYVVCYMDSLIRFVHLNVSFGHSALTGLICNPLSQLFIFRLMCNWIVYCIHSGIGAWGQMPNTFFRGRAFPPPPPPPPLPPIGCMYWINVLYVLENMFLSHSTCHIMMYHASCPMHIPLHTSIYTLTPS